jgi:alkylated DNA repair dioxygenase AlkB
MFNIKSTIIDKEDWVYYKRAINAAYFKKLYNEIMSMIGPNFSRQSCLFGKNTSNDGSGYDVPSYPWDAAPDVVHDIVKEVSNLTNCKFDYCLVHLYVNGKSSIGWHNDKEAFSAPVVSLSLGAPRKFRFRKLGRTCGYDYQYIMNSGDIITMKNTCQQKWEHCIPVESGINEPRINITFRQF